MQKSKIFTNWSITGEACSPLIYVQFLRREKEKTGSKAHAEALASNNKNKRILHPIKLEEKVIDCADINSFVDAGGERAGNSALTACTPHSKLNVLAATDHDILEDKNCVVFISISPTAFSTAPFFQPLSLNI